MDKLEVIIIDPSATAMLDKMASEKLIRVKRSKARRSRLRVPQDRLAFYLSAPVMSDEEYAEYQQTREWMNRWRTN